MVHRDEVGVPSNPNFFEWILKGNLLTTGGENKACLNVFHFRRFSGSAVPNAGAIEAAIWSSLATPLTAATVSRYTVPLRTLRMMDDPASAAIDYTANPLTGGLEEEGYASDSAVYMQLVTGARGRNFLGSKHFGGLSEDDAEDDQLDASGVTHWDAVRDVLAGWGTAGATVDGNNWRLVVLSPSLSDLVSYPSVFTSADIASVALNLTIGTMGGRRQRTVR